MAISHKIKAMLELKGKSKSGLAAQLRINDQSLRNKFVRNCFSADDLILTADYIGAELAFTVDDHRFVLRMDDLQRKRDN